MSVAMLVPTIILIGKKGIESTTDAGVVLSFITMLSMMYTAVKLVHLVHIKANPKEKIYDDEIQGYNLSFMAFTITLAKLTSFVILVVLKDFKSFFWLGLVISTTFILQLIDFVITSKKYSQYKITYEEYGKRSRRLFPNVNE